MREGPCHQLMFLLDELLEDDEDEEHCDDVSLNAADSFLSVELFTKESLGHKTTDFAFTLLKSTVMMSEKCYQLKC